MMTSLGPKRTVGLVVTHKSKMAASVGGNGSGRSVPHSRARSKIKRPGGCGGYTCCFPGCFNNHKKDPDLSFHSFPSGKSLEKQELRQKWIDIVNTAMGRKDFKPSSGHRVCSAHFPGGQKTYMNDLLNVLSRYWTVHPHQNRFRIAAI